MNWDRYFRLKKRYELRAPLLDEINPDLPILVPPFRDPRFRPVRLSTRVPLGLRQLAYKVKRHPKLAERVRWYLIYPDGTMAGHVERWRRD